MKRQKFLSPIPKERGKNFMVTHKTTRARIIKQSIMAEEHFDKMELCLKAIDDIAASRSGFINEKLPELILKLSTAEGVVKAILDRIRDSQLASEQEFMVLSETLTDNLTEMLTDIQDTLNHKPVDVTPNVVQTVIDLVNQLRVLFQEFKEKL
jgi:hypothetical protein